MEGGGRLAAFVEADRLTAGTAREDRHFCAAFWTRFSVAVFQCSSTPSRMLRPAVARNSLGSTPMAGILSTLVLAASRVHVPVALIVLLSLTIVVLVLLLWSVKRRPDVRLRSTTVPDDALPLTVAGLTQGEILDGNDLRLLENGAFFEALLADVAAAERSVHLETFLWKEGVLAERISEALMAKARDGVAVRLLVDASGGRQIRHRLKTLRAAGCLVDLYHPFHIRNLGWINNRDHRKIAVIDGRIGYVGGHCITDNWLGTAHDAEHFRDLSVRVEGPVVRALQSAFCENWMEAAAEVPAGPDYFPPLSPCGPTRASLAYITAAGRASSVQLLHALAVQAARRTIRIQNPYFLPDPEAIDLLGAAVKRGVDVRVMLPSASATDSPIVQHASHHKFGALLGAGVRIFEYTATLLHQKVFTVDTEWAAIGSTNYDDRSFEINDEVMLCVYDAKMAAVFEEVFERDLAKCREVHLDEWKRRPLGHRLLDFAGFVVNEQL